MSGGIVVVIPGLTSLNIGWNLRIRTSSSGAVSRTKAPLVSSFHTCSSARRASKQKTVLFVSVLNQSSQRRTQQQTCIGGVTAEHQSDLVFPAENKYASSSNHRKRQREARCVNNFINFPRRVATTLALIRQQAPKTSSAIYSLGGHHYSTSLSLSVALYLLRGRSLEDSKQCTVLSSFKTCNDKNRKNKSEETKMYNPTRRWLWPNFSSSPSRENTSGQNSIKKESLGTVGMTGPTSLMRSREHSLSLPLRTVQGEVPKRATSGDKTSRRRKGT